MCLHLCVGTVADLWLEGDVASQRLGDGVRMCRPSLVGVGPPKYIIVPCPVASHTSDFRFRCLMCFFVALKCSGCVVVSLRKDPTPYLRDSKSIIYIYLNHC